MGTSRGSIVLSQLEFDVLWESERLPRRHVALDVTSPGETHTERAELSEQAWRSLSERGLARRGTVTPEVADLLTLLANATVTIDVWVWAEQEISAVAACLGDNGLLAIVDDQVWLVPVRANALPEAAVSVIGQVGPGVGRSVNLPHSALRRADSGAAGDPVALITALADRNVELGQAQELAGMLAGQQARGQFGAQSTGRDGRVHRLDRVVGFFENDSGRYLFQLARNADGTDWATIAPSDNNLLVERVRELTEEL